MGGGGLFRRKQHRRKKVGRKGIHPPSPWPLINNKHKENLTLAFLRKNKSSLLPSIKDGAY